MSGIQENKDLQQKQNTEDNTGNQKKKRLRQRIRRRNKINKCTAAGTELPQKGDCEAGVLEILTSNELSVKLNDLNVPKAKINTTIATSLNSSSNSNHITKPVQLKSSNLKLQDKSDSPKSPINKGTSPLKQSEVEIVDMSTIPVAVNTSTGKSREEVMAEREAKKLAKQTKKAKALEAGAQTTILTENVIRTPVTAASALEVGAAKQQILSLTTTPTTTYSNANATAPAAADKSREQIKAERGAKKKAKQALKDAKAGGTHEITADLEVTNITPKLDSSVVLEEKKKPNLTKAERRALQEAQRAAKSQKNHNAQGKTAESHKEKVATDTPVKTTPTIAASSSPMKSASPLRKSLHTNDCKVRLFNHLQKARQDASLFLNNPHIHPNIARLGEQYAQRTIVGSNARCIGFLNALKMVIRDFETPPNKEFTRSLETAITNSVEHLQKCRPLAVSVSNAYKHIKHVLTQLPTGQLESDLKENLCHFIDTYIENQIGKAAEAISYSVQEKISNGDVILTFGCSSLITYIFEEAQRRRVDFRVIVVDSRPFCEGQELLRRLAVKEIPCSYVLINAISFVMPEATKVLLGAHALLANGYVMARTGTAQVALVAHSFNVPVLVCCETHKFSERSQTDAIVYNELGNPDDLIRSDKCSLTNWQSKGKMSPLNLMYDITPPELVTAVVTEVSILPCTSVPVILRIKPTEIGY